MDENFVNIYVDTLNKRLEEFVKNESVANAKLRLSEEIIKALDEKVKEVSKEKDEFINDTTNVMLQKDSEIEELVKQNDALTQAAEDLTKEYDTYRYKLDAQYTSAVNHASNLERAHNDVLEQMKKKDDEISILQETHRKEKQHLEAALKNLEKETNNTPRKHVKKLT